MGCFLSEEKETHESHVLGSGGESGLTAIMRRPATMIATLLAVIVVALSMFAATPIALAEPESTAAPTTTAAPANPTPSGTTAPDVENSNQGDSETGDNGTPSPPSPQVRPTGSLLIKKSWSIAMFANPHQS